MKTNVSCIYGQQQLLPSAITRFLGRSGIGFMTLPYHLQSLVFLGRSWIGIMTTHLPNLSNLEKKKLGFWVGKAWVDDF